MSVSIGIGGCRSKKWRRKRGITYSFCELVYVFEVGICVIAKALGQLPRKLSRSYLHCRLIGKCRREPKVPEDHRCAHDNDSQYQTNRYHGTGKQEAALFGNSHDYGDTKV